MKSLRLFVSATLFSCSCLCLSGLSFADTLSMPQGSAQEQTLPKRGMTKQQVESNYGSPDSKHGPRGTPPIYYWEYAAYTVYFESDYVLHTVVKQPAKAAAQAY